MLRALVAGLTVGAICPAIGLFLVLRRLALIADTLAHISLAGVALGLLVGFSPTLGALAVALLGAIGIERLRASGRLYGEAALALFLSGGFAVAVVLLSFARGFNADLFAYLFGSLLTVTPLDLVVILGLGGVVGTAVILFYKELFAITFNEELAQVGGIPVKTMNLLLTILTALTVVISMRVVGILLISAMLVIPTVTSLQFSRSFKSALLLAVAFALVAVFMGLTAAYYLNLAAGGTIVLVALAIFAGVSLFRRGPVHQTP
jgi:zinc transport system permease protein